ncbi:T9SS type A sorting domain-containing protein, partial [Hallella colorans]
LSYMFTAGEGEMATDRFTLVNTTATSFADWATSVSSVDSDINGDATVYTLSGHVVARFNLPHDMTTMKKSLSRGVYIVSAKNGTVTTNRKLIVK